MDWNELWEGAASEINSNEIESNPGVNLVLENQVESDQPKNSSDVLNDLIPPVSEESAEQAVQKMVVSIPQSNREMASHLPRRREDSVVKEVLSLFEPRKNGESWFCQDQPLRLQR